MYRTAFPEVYSVPMIAGQAPDYIVKALQAYRAGDRSQRACRRREKPLRPGHGRPRCLLWRHREGGQMSRFLILALACFSAPSLLRRRCGTPGKLKSQTCAACHGPDGNSPAGQVFPRSPAVLRLPPEGAARLQVRRAQNPIMSGQVAASTRRTWPISRRFIRAKRFVARHSLKLRDVQAFRFFSKFAQVPDDAVRAGGLFSPCRRRRADQPVVRVLAEALGHELRSLSSTSRTSLPGARPVRLATRKMCVSPRWSDGRRRC